MRKHCVYGLSDGCYFQIFGREHILADNFFRKNAEISDIFADNSCCKNVKRYCYGNFGTPLTFCKITLRTLRKPLANFAVKELNELFFNKKNQKNKQVPAVKKTMVFINDSIYALGTCLSFILFINN